MYKRQDSEQDFSFKRVGIAAEELGNPEGADLSFDEKWCADSICRGFGERQAVQEDCAWVSEGSLAEV